MRLAEHICPTCGKLLDAATAVGDSEATPSKGDLSVCLYCGEIIEFGENLELIKADVDSIIEADFIELQKAQRLVRAWANR